MKSFITSVLFATLSSSAFALECNLECAQYQVQPNLSLFPQPTGSYYNFRTVAVVGESVEGIIKYAPTLCHQEGVRLMIANLLYTHFMNCPELHPDVDVSSTRGWSESYWRYNDDHSFSSRWKSKRK